jgi:hypothetical protein
MELELILNKNDYLQYQLYKSSKMKSMKIKKIRNRMISTILFFLIGVIFYFQNNNKIYIIVYSIISLIIFIFYPLYLKILYKRHFSKHISENYKDKIGKSGILKIKEDYIYLKNSGKDSEAKLNINEIEEIVEIQTNYFIINDNTSAIILPKNNDTNSFIDILKTKHNVKMNIELNWKWK